MTFDDLVSRADVFVDANTSIYHFTSDPISRAHELLTGDALIVAVMQDHGLIHLASNGGDFDRVPAITRYAPV